MQKNPNNDTFSQNITTGPELLSEVEEDIAIRQQRRRIFPRAALVGLCAGIVASFFRIVLAGADVLRNQLIDWSQQFPTMGWLFPMTFGLIGALVSVFLVQRFAPEASGRGIPHWKRFCTDCEHWIGGAFYL
jgi:CIC family chloride channel protein